MADIQAMERALEDSITSELLVNPVRMPHCGQVLSYSTVERWLADGSTTCPLCRRYITLRSCTPDAPTVRQLEELAAARRIAGFAAAGGPLVETLGVTGAQVAFVAFFFVFLTHTPTAMVWSILAALGSLPYAGLSFVVVLLTLMVDLVVAAWIAFGAVSNATFAVVQVAAQLVFAALRLVFGVFGVLTNVSFALVRGAFVCAGIAGFAVTTWSTFDKLRSAPAGAAATRAPRFVVLAVAAISRVVDAVRRSGLASARQWKDVGRIAGKSALAGAQSASRIASVASHALSERARANPVEVVVATAAMWVVHWTVPVILGSFIGAGGASSPAAHTNGTAGANA